MQKNRRVCIVAPVHIWDDVRVFHKEARSLSKAGYRVSLIARAESPHVHDEIEVFPTIGSGGSRLLRFLSLPLVGMQALRQWADVYHLHNPDTLPLAVLLRLSGRKVVYDTHEDFAKRIQIRTWIPKPLSGLLGVLVSRTEVFVSRIANASIATQTTVARRLKGRVLLLGNPPRIDDQLLARVADLAKDIQEPRCEVRAIFAGTISIARGLFDMVDALEIANRSSNVRLWLIGPTDSADLDRAKARPGWEFVDYLPRIRQEEAFAYMQRSDVGLMTIRDVGDHFASEPNKIYEYLVFGKPFIASGFESWRNTFTDVDAGWFVPPGSASEMASAMAEVAENRKLAEAKGARGREFTRQYNWESESRKLLELYSSVLTHG